MARYKHLLVDTPANAHGYTSTSSGGGSKVFNYPARDRGPQAAKIRSEIEAAEREAQQRANAVGAGLEVRDIALEFFGADGAGLETDRLDDRRASIEILSTRTEGGRTFATVRIPEGKLKNFLGKVQRYETENDQRRKDKGPKNKELVESIEGVRLPVVRSFWTDSDSAFPAAVTDNIWWEVWLRTGVTDHDAVFGEFVVEAERIGLRVSPQVVRFPERLVFLAFGSASQWAGSLALLGILAELRGAKEVPTDFVALTPREQSEFIEEAAARIEPPSADAPAVCLLDTGLNAGHPLLASLVEETDLHASHPDWSVADEHGHGTQMAGIAAFGGDLAEHLAGSSPIVANHRLESGKILHPTIANDPDNYGYVTTDAVAQAETAAPQRSRVVCLAVTADDRDVGFPSLWSAAIDQHASGHDDDIRRLYVVSAGNVRELTAGSFEYMRSNLEKYGIEDPAQSFNAVTVGAFTDLAHVRSNDPGFAGKTPIAPKGGLSPLSRTSVMWAAREWPLKPDIVMEGGNYLAGPDGTPEACDDLRLLTTTVDKTGNLLDTAADTSAATAQAAKLSAEMMAQYPDLWPETIRGLLVHSAEWTEQMRSEFSDETRESIHRLLRCYGYGVPNEARAKWTVENHVSLIAQDSLRPFEKKESGTVGTRECNFHLLPWPNDVLEGLGDLPVTIKITLSYFIEPSPGRRGWTSKFRYASHGLRFALRGPTEDDEAFVKRISAASWTDDERKPKKDREGDRPTTGDPQDRWAIGTDVRSRGSIHCDWWTGTAADAASSGEIAVFPVTGWWKERSHLGRFDRDARYALIVTVSCEDETVDLYTPIANQVGIVTEV